MNGKGPSVRITGGVLKNRRIASYALDALRPSKDNTRETLFNWLMHKVSGASCLDLFAGTGILGMECLSRGASDVIFVEKNRRLVQALRLNVKNLCTPLSPNLNWRVIAGDVLHWLKELKEERWHLIMCDPPFLWTEERYAQLLTQLHNCLYENGYLYLECANMPTFLQANTLWRVVKKKSIGGVVSLLLQKHNSQF